MNAILEKVRARVAVDFATADPAHDIGHVDRVAALAGEIAARTGADPRIARVAAYVHDYHRVEEARQDRRPIRPEDACGAVLRVLEECGVPQEWHPPILRAVELTGRYRFADEELDDQCAIAAAVHDADNLDAMGAIGIGRAFAYGGLLGEPLWDPESALKDVYQEGETSSVLAHLYEKLIRLEQDMLTEPARRLAADRALLLHRFAAGFRSEWDRGQARVRWDARTRFLSVEAPRGDDDEPVVRVSFRGQVRLTFDEQGQVTAVDLPDVPAGPDGAWTWTDLADGGPGRHVSGVGDIEVQLRKNQPVALHLHLRGETGD
ncbi:HD domain-containing protein [Nonomuraea sp. NPDC005650]|uniref:HD domain-containing protein n=1 Tax=Nonomuraea sp. NPDC005650 TaxID=3157045 RepID=UPI0033BDCFF1